MANRTRNIVLRVPVTAEERAMIEKKMRQMGTRCFSTYARKMLIDGYVIRLDYSDVKAMTAELQKIGTNINQIARRVNATGTVYAVYMRLNTLTKKELQTVQLQLSFLPLSEMLLKLGISNNGLKWRNKQIYRKLEVQSKRQMLSLLQPFTDKILNMEL